MAEDKTARIVVTASGFGWGTGWLFTVGFVHLGVWKAILALFIWPALLGGALSP